MTDNIANFPGLLRDNFFDRTLVKPQDVLRGAMDDDPKQVSVITLDQEGELMTYASCSTPEANLLLDFARFQTVAGLLGDDQ